MVVATMGLVEVVAAPRSVELVAVDQAGMAERGMRLERCVRTSWEGDPKAGDAASLGLDRSRHPVEP